MSAILFAVLSTDLDLSSQIPAGKQVMKRTLETVDSIIGGIGYFFIFYGSDLFSLVEQYYLSQSARKSALSHVSQSPKSQVVVITNSIEEIRPGTKNASAVTGCYRF
ncbi:hypothetical protein PCO86_15680 [Pectobacteriaceae bacterium CE70]|nr:hypothetical protein PCO87_16390 [Pectobacteriaceae bacterium C52]WJV65741.1 hypothetical protein PCO86_15680 [Pectobacteriaceae bacterium CE70]WJY09763.1 hypothetical protein PCO80_15620 [Pectobacteriaceae bacterium C80]